MFLRHTEYDPVFKTVERYYFDEDDNIVVAMEQDVGAMVEHNKAYYAQMDEHARWGGDGDSWGSLVASIPTVLWFQLPEGIRKDENELRKWLNDRDNLVFRKRPGRV